jgi:hypothetical protein
MSLGLSTGAFANETDQIKSKLAHGEYSSAYEEAAQLETVHGYGLAAEILLTEIMLGQAEKNKKQAKRARKLADAALQLDPNDQHARLQYAIADGFVTRETGDVSAWMKKLPQKTYAIVQAYRDDFPTDPRGDALLGAWHLAIARKAGNQNAEKWFDASIAQGRALFQSAREMAADDIIINVNYAFSLLALEEEDITDISEARQILFIAMNAEPTNHLEQVLKTYAEEAFAQIEDRERVQRYTEIFLEGERPRLE